MKNIKTIFTVVVLFLAWTAPPLWSQDSNMDKPAGATAAVSDLIFLRPLSVVGSALTTSIFLLSLPFTYPIDRGHKTSTVLVQKPWNYTANRSLGIFRHQENIPENIDKEINVLYGEFLGRTNANREPINLE